MAVVCQGEDLIFLLRRIAYILDNMGEYGVVSHMTHKVCTSVCQYQLLYNPRIPLKMCGFSFL